MHILRLLAANVNHILMIKKYKPLFPLLLLTILMLVTWLPSINLALVYFSLLHIIGFGLVFICYIIYVFSRKYYKRAVLITLIMGLFQLCKFTMMDYDAVISIGQVSIAFQLHIFLIILLTYMLYFKQANQSIIKYIQPNLEELATGKHKITQEAIEMYKDQYQNYTNEKLEKIVEDKRYVAEAVVAAQQVLGERQKN